MFANLREALDQKNITLKAYAAVLGVTEKTIQNKLNCLTPFTLPEVWTTCFDLLPEYSWSYLFTPSNDGTDSQVN